MPLFRQEIPETPPHDVDADADADTEMRDVPDASGCLTRKRSNTSTSSSDILLVRKRQRATPAGLEGSASRPQDQHHLLPTPSPSVVNSGRVDLSLPERPSLSQIRASSVTYPPTPPFGFSIVRLQHRNTTQNRYAIKEMLSNYPNASSPPVSPQVVGARQQSRDETMTDRHHSPGATKSSDYSEYCPCTLSNHTCMMGKRCKKKAVCLASSEHLLQPSILVKLTSNNRLAI